MVQMVCSIKISAEMNRRDDDLLFAFYAEMKLPSTLIIFFD